MGFSKGQLIFAALFFVAFIVAMIWAYGKDKKINHAYFSGNKKLLLIIIAAILIVIAIIKVKI